MASNTVKRRTQTLTKQNTVSDEATEIKNEIKHTLTVLWAEIDPWQQDNHYIHSHYRPVSNSYKGCLKSLFYLHNESINIWSHLLGSLIFCILGFRFYTSYLLALDSSGSVTTTDKAVFACFFAGAIGCLGASGTYHMLCNHSFEISRFGNKIDYLGIVLLIWGSFVPSIYYGFVRDYGLLVWVYWGMITVLAAACAVVSVGDRFRTKEWRPWRAGMFVALGLSAVVPVLHGLVLFGAAGLDERMGLSWVVLQGCLYVTGAGLYAGRIPERFKPGTFDVFGSSHQIFHFLVLMAAGAHYIGLLKAFEHDYQRRSEIVLH